MVWHLDVGLSFPKSVGSLIGGSAGVVVGLGCVYNPPRGSDIYICAEVYHLIMLEIDTLTTQPTTR